MTDNIYRPKEKMKDDCEDQYTYLNYLITRT